MIKILHFLASSASVIAIPALILITVNRNKSRRYKDGTCNSNISPLI